MFGLREGNCFFHTSTLFHTSGFICLLLIHNVLCACLLGVCVMVYASACIVAHLPGAPIFHHVLSKCLVPSFAIIVCGEKKNLLYILTCVFFFLPFPRSLGGFSPAARATEAFLWQHHAVITSSPCSLRTVSPCSILRCGVHNFVLCLGLVTCYIILLYKCV